MLKSEAAAYLAGVTQTEGAEASAPTNLHVITGEVGEASADGKTLVKIDGLMFSESDDQFIEVDALGGLEEGDIATIVLTGEQGHAMTPLALGSIGSVDRITVRIAAIEADYIKVEQLDAAEARIGELEADHVSVDDLDAATARIGELEADHVSVDDLDAATARIGTLETTRATVTDLEAATARIHNLEVDHVSIDDFEAEQANIDQLQADTADIGTIRANSAKVQNLTAAQLEADHATVGSLSTTYATIANLNAANGRITNLESTKANISDLEADYITADEIEATYMHANMSNSDVAWIENGTIKNGAIVSAMINDVSANKLTAGTINGSVINVTNLNADNITTGTINGQRIGEGSLSLSKLEDDVYTESEVDAKLATMQAEIDGAIETWTGTAVPTLNNSPASNWKTAAVRDTHVGDVYFVVNSQSQQNGYNYRFTKSGSTYSWQLIKDSDVTNALQRLETAEGKITTFDSDISTLKTDTGSLTTRTTNLETRMSDAEDDILDKVDTTTFNEVSDTVDQHSQTISQHTTAISNKADSSTVTAVTNRVSKNEQDISGINTTIGELQDTVETKADGSTVSTISNKLNTVSDTVDGHTQTLTSVQNTLSTKADSSTVTTLSNTVNTVKQTADTNASNISSLQTTVSGHTTTISQHTTAIQQNTDAIALRATKTEVQQVRPAYASSSTAAGTAAKVATIDPAVTGYSLYKGASVAVTFSKANTAATPTLNLNSTGAKQIRSYTGAALSEAEYKWAAGATIDLVYDGTYWRMQDSGSVKRVTAAEASIRVNADNIESKVSKDGVISSINQSAETVKIKAEKVEIDGTAVFSAISSDVDDAITGKGYQTASQVNSAITSKGYATTTQAQGYASTAKSEAISAAATDATTKANAAQTAATNAANTATDNKLKSYSTTAQANNLYDAKGAATTAENNAKAYTDALEIGGRNLLLGTAAMKSGTGGWNTGTFRASGGTLSNVTTTDLPLPSVSGALRVANNGSSATEVGFAQDGISGLIAGETYTESGWIRASAAMEGFFQPIWRSSSQTTVPSNNAAGKRFNLTTDWQWFSWTGTLNGDQASTYNGGYVYAASVPVGGWFEVCGLKLEKGNKATDWSPAPEDVAANIAAAQATANAAAPKTNAVKRTQRIWYRKSASGAPSTPGTASSNWVTKADDGNDAWTKMHIAISSTHKYIYTCEQYEMANGTVGYTSVLLDNTITVIDGGNIITHTVTAEQIDAASINASKSLTVGAMTDAAASTILNSNIQVGGRNLLRSTGSPSIVSLLDYTDWVVTSGGNGVGSIETISDSPVPAVTRAFRITGNTSGNRDFAQKNKTLESDFTGPYRFSAWVRGVGGSVNALIRSWNQTTDKAAFSKTIYGIGADWTYIDFEFVPSGNGAKLGDLLDARFGMTGAGSIEYVAPKLERGNKATDWSPAPEDMVASVNQTYVQNLTPYFLTDMTKTSDEYWARLTYERFNRLGDGWAHFEYTNSGSSTVNNFIKPKVLDFLEPGGKYTLLIEFKNVSISKDGGSFYSQQGSDFQVWGNHDYCGFTITNAEIRALSGGAGAFYKTLTLLTADSKDPSGTVRGSLPKTNFMSINQQVQAGQTVSYDLRLSLYEDGYTGPYKPYSGDQLYATNSALAGTNESLEGAITDIGELSDQLVDTTTEQNKTITTIQTYLNSLRQDLDAEIQSRQQWLNFDAAEGLVIGAKNSAFKTVTTNTSQQFKNGGTVLAETSGMEFVAPVMRSDQILIGNWMWTRRDNGNLSLKWIG